jgi:hypothetical protein
MKKGRPDLPETSAPSIFRATAAVLAALANLTASQVVNTAFVERHNETDLNRNARKVRKTYGFSKDWWIHRALTFFTVYSDQSRFRNGLDGLSSGG